MESTQAILALAALAQEHRLAAYRLLVEAGPAGLPAGEIAAALKLAPNSLSFHLDRLRQANLIAQRRDGRSLIYAARFEAMNGLVAYLTENCCGGDLAQRAPGATACAPAARVEFAVARRGKTRATT
jgi:ArsR family transcriptional regulator